MPATRGRDRTFEGKDHPRRIKYICPRCNFTTNHKHTLLTHLERMTMCNDVNDIFLTRQVKDLAAQALPPEEIKNRINNQEKRIAFDLTIDKIVDTLNVDEKIESLEMLSTVFTKYTWQENMAFLLNSFRNVLDDVKFFDPNKLMLYPHFCPDSIIVMILKSFSKFDPKSQDNFYGLVYNTSVLYDFSDNSIKYLQNTNDVYHYRKPENMDEFFEKMIKYLEPFFKSYLSYLMRAYHTPNITDTQKKHIEERLWDINAFLKCFFNTFTLFSQCNSEILSLNDEETKRMDIDPNSNTIYDYMQSVFQNVKTTQTPDYKKILEVKITEKLKFLTKLLNMFLKEKLRSNDSYRQLIAKIEEKGVSMLNETNLKDSALFFEKQTKIMPTTRIITEESLKCDTQSWFA